VTGMRKLLAAFLLVTGCSAADIGGIGPDAGPVDNYVLKTPGIVAVSPGLVSVGDKIQVIGSDFVDPVHGTLALRVTGTFNGTDNGASTVDRELPLTFKNAGIGEAEFGPDVIFSPTGDETGVFQGKAQVIARKLDGQDELISGELDLRMEVGPSLILQAFHAAGKGCADVTEATSVGSDFAIGVKAIGMGTGTPTNPLTFRFHVSSPALVARYVVNKSYSRWPLDPASLDTFADAPAGNSYFEVQATNGKVAYVDPSTMEQVVHVSPSVRIAQLDYDEVKLASLRPGPFAGNGPVHMNVVIEVENGSDSAMRAATVKVFNEGELKPYDGSFRIAERYAPAQVSACFAGGDIGRDLTYTEGNSESRSRNTSYRWDINNARTVGVSVGTTFNVGTGIQSPIQFGGSLSVSSDYHSTLSTTFGVDVSESVSSEHHINQNLTAHILPTYFGVCFRQTERVEREVGIMYTNSCGVQAEIAKVVLTDWTWGFDIATGPGCPPPTNLPPGQVF
jgi:hypothetical protein